MSMAKRFWKGASRQLVSAFNRADELGGEVRDYLQERIDRSERAQQALEKLRELRGKQKKNPGRERRAAQQARQRREDEKAAETAAAPPPTAAAVAAAKAATGLGDPDVKAQIYGRTSCPWTGRSIRLLEDRKIDYDYIDLEEEENAPLEEKLVAETKQNTVPYIYLRGKFVGGYNALSEIDRLGQLGAAIMSDAEKAAAGPDIVKVEVARRDNTDEVPPAESA